MGDGERERILNGDVGVRAGDLEECGVRGDLGEPGGSPGSV